LVQWGTLRGDLVGVVSTPVQPCVVVPERKMGGMERLIAVAEVRWRELTRKESESRFRLQSTEITNKVCTRQYTTRQRDQYTIQYQTQHNRTRSCLGSHLTTIGRASTGLANIPSPGFHGQRLPAITAQVGFVASRYFEAIPTRAETKTRSERGKR
jgi:hypothetical protein